MCGIAGYHRSPSAGRPDLRRMIAVLAHRGPDGEGIHEDGPVGLAHRRLAILDLSDAGAQPMASPDGRLVVTYNGEIFNYLELRDELTAAGWRFRSRTDTEVILAAYHVWGDDCVRRFNGMWAFALWDGRRRRLFCARDRFGVKPFVYCVRPGGTLVFASEPKAILAACPEERRPDMAALNAFLVHGITMAGDRTFYAAIRQLPSAHTMSVDDAGITLRRYWSYPEKAPQPPGPEQDETFLALLSDAVRLRARSDVEIGTTVSGGLDSSTIAAVFRRLFPDLPHRGYAAVFTGAPYDETRYIDAAAAAYDLTLCKVPQSGTGVVEDLARLAWYMDAPTISPAVVPLHRVMEAARQDGIKVLFDGQGADELLGGYDTHFRPRHIHSLVQAMGRSPGPATLSRLLGGIAGIRRPDLPHIARYLLPGLQGPYRRFVGATAGLAPELLATDPGLGDHPSRLYPDPLDNALHQAHAYTILPGLLHYGDAVSMASSVETRLPFLDYRLVEFGFGLPVSDKIGPEGGKAVLRRGARGVLIDEIRLRRWKNGFNTPIRDWLLADPRLPMAMAAGNAGRHGVVRPGALDLGSLKRLPPPHLLRRVSVQLWLAVCIDGGNMSPPAEFC